MSASRVTDIMGMPQLQVLSVHIVMTLVVLVLLRIALQLALMHEAHDPIERDEPLLCIHCRARRAGHGVLPGVRCGHPGVVARVAPRAA